MLLGLYILLKFKENETSRHRDYLPSICGACLALTIVLGRIDPVLVASGVYRNGTIVTSKKILSIKDGKTATVTLFRNGECLVLSTNGKPDASVNVKGGISGDEYTMALASVLPLAVCKDHSTAAVIGMGSGMSAHYMLYDTTLTSLDVIEIEPAMVEAAEKIGPKVANTFTDKRCQTYIDDAKTFFSARNRKYDIIVSEPSNPWVSGVSGLFSEEFFGLVKNHLNEHGILVQWFHKYESDVSILVSVFEALRIHFPNYCMYMAGTDLITIATADLSTDLSLKRDVFNFKPLAKNLKQMGFKSTSDFTIMQFATNNLFSPLFEIYPYPTNSDYYPFVDLNAVKYRFTDEYIQVADTLRKYIVPVRKILESDTQFIAYDIRDQLPDLNNFKEFNNAKILYKELRSITTDTGIIDFPYDHSKEVITLDYASKNPQRMPFEQLFSSLAEIIEKTIPYLSASEMRDIYDILETKTASMGLTDDDKVWMGYFKALCYYDMRTLQKYSKDLLPQNEEIEINYMNQFLLTSLFISAYKTGDTTDVESYWDHYKGKDKPDVMVKFTHGLISRE
jgi:spermidine synthase